MHSRTRFRRVPLYVALTLALLPLLACSGPDTPGQTPTGGATATTTRSPGPAPTATTATPPATTTTPLIPTAPSAPTSTTPQQATTTATAAAPTPAPPVDLGTVAIELELAGSGFTNPVYVTHAGDGSGRVYVAEKVGRVKLLDGTTVLDISDRVYSPPVPSLEQELGFIGLAFHPRFEENGYLYVHYINHQQEHVISRFQASADGRIDPNDEKVLLRHVQIGVNFAGGMLAFGPDGYLYIGLGTGDDDDPHQVVAQDLGSLFGKVLRIDVDNGDPYAIPPDNPFVGTPGARSEVWIAGARNPYRFAFDRASGDLYVGQPGEFQRESLYFLPAGAAKGRNLGWPILEGDECWEFWTGPCDPAGLEQPAIAYQTYEAGNCAHISGFVYRGTAFPSLQGVFFFGDYCSGRVFGAARDAAGTWQWRELARTDALIGSFGEDEAGELYVTDIRDGEVYRIVGR